MRSELQFWGKKTKELRCLFITLLHGVMAATWHPWGMCMDTGFRYLQAKLLPGIYCLEENQHVQAALKEGEAILPSRRGLFMCSMWNSSVKRTFVTYFKGITLFKKKHVQWIVPGHHSTRF